MHEAIDRFVAKYIQLTEEELAFFHSLLKHKKLRKKNFLLQEGDICDFEAFVLKGCIRSYYLDKDGVETILLFVVEVWSVCDLTIFSEQKLSNLFIETLEDCEHFSIDYKKKIRLVENIQTF